MRNLVVLKENALQESLMPMHLPQRMHSAVDVVESFSPMALVGHTLTQALHPVHLTVVGEARCARQ
jgi:hypothetical protein